MQYFNHISIIALKYHEILLNIKSSSIYSLKKIIQIVCHATSLDHTSQMSHRLHVLKIYDLIDLNICITMHNIFYKLVPLASQDKLSMSSSKKYENNLHVMLA